MSINRQEKIIAIIPALNEEGKIGKVVSRIKNEAADWVDKILVINDGSTDNTCAEAEGCGAMVISHKYKTGVGAAIRTGIDYALKDKYDIAVIMGGDDQDNPSEIKRLISPILNDCFYFVQGSRYMAGGKYVNMPIFRWITTSIYSFLFKIITRFPISDGTNGFRAFRLSVFNSKDINIWQPWLSHYELEPYLFYKVIEHNLKMTEVPVTKSYPRNDGGYTKMIPIFDWWGILRPIILLKLGIRK